MSGGELLDDVVDHLSDYVVFQPRAAMVVALWVMTTHVFDVFDKFAILAITSAEKRSGKTTLLILLLWICKDAVMASNVSPASVYRLIELTEPTLLIDEAQSLTRRGSEATEVLREVLCAGIARNAVVMRVGGPNNDEVKKFAIACPKVIALIGQPDGVVMDRCLPIEMRRKTPADVVRPYRSRVAEPEGKALRESLEAWAKDCQEQVQAVYDALEPFDTGNDRLDEMLLPLMAVAQVVDPACLPELKEYAGQIVAKEKDAERQSPGVMLLAACREVFAAWCKADPAKFLPTANLIVKLIAREEEPWATYTRGQPITAAAIAELLRPYGIRSCREQKKNTTTRGFVQKDFAEAWRRYLPPPPKKPD